MKKTHALPAAAVLACTLAACGGDTLPQPPEDVEGLIEGLIEDARHLGLSNTDPAEGSGAGGWAQAAAADGASDARPAWTRLVVADEAWGLLAVAALALAAVAGVGLRRRRGGLMPRGTPPTLGLSASAGEIAPAPAGESAPAPAPSPAPSAGTAEAPSPPPQPARYAGPRAAQWTALQRAGWRCQGCGRAGILEVFRVGKGMDGGLSDLETLFALCRLCQPRFLSAAEETTPVPWSAEDPRFEDVSGRTVVIDLDQLDTVSRGGGHGARTTVRYRPRRGGACFLLTSGYPFVCREIDRALEARNRPRLVDWEPAEPPGECLPPGDWEGGAR